MYPLLDNSHSEEPVSLSVSPQQGSEFRGKVILSVPPPPYKQGPYYSGPLTTEEWIEQAEYIGADGIAMGMERWWDNIPLYKTELQKYKDAGFSVTLGWDSHGVYNYDLRFFPELHYWSMDNQHKQMVNYWRVYVDSNTQDAAAYKFGKSFVNNLDTTSNPDGSITVKIRDLDYYTPVYGGGVTYNISSVYEKYPASEFSWAYDESGVGYDPTDTQYEEGSRLTYGTDYEIYIENNAMYAKIYNPSSKKFNLYVLFYFPGSPSIYLPDGREVYFETLRGFFGNFSPYADAHVQNDGGFPILAKEGDFHPEIIMQVEAKYGIDFNFDNWVVYQRAHYDWDKKHLTQYAFTRENYLIFKDYAKEKQDITHSYGMIYIPTGSDMFAMLEGMLEHVDALLVNVWEGWQYRAARWGYSGGTTTWTPTSTRLGIWEAYMIHNTTSGNDIMSWTKAAADELLKWNPDSSTLYYWQVTDNDWNISNRLDDFKAAIQYFHDRFRHVSMLPHNVERYTVAKAYPISYTYRYGDRIDLNPGQIDIDIIYAKDLKWDPVPTDGCLIPWSQGGIVGHSQTDDMQAHEKIEQAVEGGSGIALSGSRLRNLEDYYEGTDIPSIYKSMFQSASWTHESRPGVEPHYLTFNGTLDPGQLNDKVGNGHWFQLEANSTGNIIVGEHPVAGLYEAAYSAGKVIGYGSSYDPFKEYLTDETSATYGDEYFVRLVEKAAGKEGSFRLWDVGKTYVYKLDDNTYYALLVERYGFSRDVPLTVYGAEDLRITDMDTGAEIPNNSTVYLEENSTRLFKIQLGVSSAPRNLQTDAGDGYVNLSWEAPSDIGGSAITGYNIYRDDTAGVHDTVPAGQLWFYDDDVTNGATYTYDVAAVNIIGEGADASTSATPMTVPSAPQNLLATAENGYIVLTWSIPPDDGGSVITGYNIYRDGTVTVFQTVSATQLSYEDHDVTDGMTYTYYVSTYNIMGDGSLSNKAGAKAGSGPAVPSTITATAGDSYVYLTWDIPISNGSYPVTNYTIYRGTSSDGETFFIILGNSLSTNDTTVVNDVTYYYRISATNAIAEGTISNSVSAMPQAPAIPVNKPPTSAITSPFEGDSIEGILDISGTSSDADGSVQRIEIKINDGNWITVTGTTSWTYNLDTTQLSDGEHTITVRSYDGKNYSAETEISVTVANPEEEEEAEPESPVLWIIIIIIVLVLVLVLLLIMRKKKPAEEETSGEHPSLEQLRKDMGWK